MSTPVRHRAFISLGSNIEPEQNLPRAVELLAQSGDVIAKSNVWQSAPVGDVHQADFYNAAVLIETTLSPVVLKESLRQIESQLKRVRDPHNKNAARTIDLDLSLYDQETIMVENRPIPDPDILKRPFVAIPLAELDSDYLHPVEQVTLQKIASRFDLDQWGMKQSETIRL
ncbi:MAG: 2-amino-4-hydroxy-6-hydroxymethyldihydropteridine diphosphokinase [Planctomycetaceae bacterium]